MSLGGETRNPADLTETISFNDLSDVTITSVADNDLIQFNSTSGDWENVTVASLAASIALTDLSDVNTSGVNTGDFLQKSIGDWVDFDLFGTANNWTAEQSFQAGIALGDNDNITLGTGGDATIDYDGTNLVIDPKVVGSGFVDLNGGDIKANSIALGGDEIDPLNLIVSEGSSSTVGILWRSSWTYTGSVNPRGIQFTLINNSTASNSSGGFFRAIQESDNTGTSEASGGTYFVKLDNTTLFTQGTKQLYAGVFEDSTTNSEAHTNTAFQRAAVYGKAMPTLTLGAGSTDVAWAGLFGDDVQIFSDKKLILEGSESVKGDSYLIFNSATTDIELFVDNTSTMKWDNDLVESLVPHRMLDKVSFTQTDDLEFIDSENDGDLDYHATTSHDFSIGGTEQLTLTDGVFAPTTDADVDFGTSTERIKRLHHHDYLSFTVTADSNASAAEFNIFDEDNYAAFTKTDNLTAQGYTYTQSTGNFDVTNSGIHEINCGFNLLTSANANALLIIKVNGTPVYSHTIRTLTANPFMYVVTIFQSLTAGDDLTFHVDSNTAATLTIHDGTYINLKRFS